MGYKKVNSDSYDERKITAERLKRFNNDFAYAAGISLADYNTAIELVKSTGNAFNTKVDEAATAKDAHEQALANADRILKALRSCIAGVKGRDCDEYVTAGGTRQSEVSAQQQQTREEKKKAAKETAKQAAEAEAQKVTAEAVRKALEEAATKAA